MAENNLPTKIMVVDDDNTVTTGIEKMLERHHIAVVKAHDLDTALYQYNNNKIDFVVIEIEFGPLNGIMLAQKWRKHENPNKRNAAIVFSTSVNRNMQTDALIRELGDFDIIAKPIKDTTLLSILSKAVVTQKNLESFASYKEKILDYYTKSGDYSKAAESVRLKIDQLGPKGLELLYDLYEKAGKYKEALDVVSAMLEKKSNDISLINAKARILMRLGRTTEALPLMEKADELAPGNIDRMNEAAEMYLKLNKPMESIKKFQELMKANPENPDYKFECYSKLYEYGFEKEAQDFGQKTSTPKEIVRYYNNKGVMLSKVGKTEEALKEYERAVKFYPNFKENFRIYYNIALAFFNKKTKEDFLKAESYFKKCLELSPGFDKAERGLQTTQNAIHGKKAS